MKKFKVLVSVFMVLVLIVSIFSVTLVTTNAEEIFNQYDYCGCPIDTRVPVSDSTVYNNVVRNSLPTVVDLSNSASFPSIGDQGFINSCTSWATTYYQFGYQVASMNSWNSKNNTYYQFSPKWTYNLINNGMNQGTAFIENYDILESQGAVRFSEFTPTGDLTVSEYKQWCTSTSAMENALRYRISDHHFVSFSNTSNYTPITSPASSCLNVMKNLINDGYVLTFSVDNSTLDEEELTCQYNDDYNGDKVWIKYYDSDSVWKGHALSIVGYDDNIYYDLNGDGAVQEYEKGAFKIANSIGTDFGNDGFIWAMYDAFNYRSNTDVQNIAGREAISMNYSYNYIEIEEYPLDLLVELTLTQKTRGSIKVDLGGSDIAYQIPHITQNTLLFYRTDAISFSGAYNTEETATFVFDLHDLDDYSLSWYNYYLAIGDLSSNNGTMVNRIKIKDSTEKILLNLALNERLKGIERYYKYTIAMLGDINSDGYIDDIDASLLSNYLVGSVELSAQQLKVADVDGNGITNIYDSTYISRYYIGVTTVFPGGKFELIS